jgi:hypothetical protein
MGFKVVKIAELKAKATTRNVDVRELRADTAAIAEVGAINEIIARHGKYTLDGDEMDAPLPGFELTLSAADIAGDKEWPMRTRSRRFKKAVTLLGFRHASQTALRDEQKIVADGGKLDVAQIDLVVVEGGKTAESAPVMFTEHGLEHVSKWFKALPENEQRAWIAIAEARSNGVEFDDDNAETADLARALVTDGSAKTNTGVTLEITRARKSA